MADDANTNHTPHRIPLAQYLFTRLSHLGIRHVHGVPGDYTLTALDHINPSTTGLRWVGNASELCAGYAADGYARTKSSFSRFPSSSPSSPPSSPSPTTTTGIGALLTSFGVGELSAINAVAGAYAERVPVVHVVGTPPRAAQAQGLCLHHTLGDGDHGVFARAHAAVTVAQALLVDPLEAPAQIDGVLRECVRASRPVYVALPTDMVGVGVVAPEGPLFGGEGDDGSGVGVVEEGAVEERQRVAEAAVAAMLAAKRPLLLVDGFAARFGGVRDEVNELVAATGFATLTTPFGKSIVDEALAGPNFHGVHAGMAGEPAVRSWVDGCDLVLRFGPLDSDINTFGFTALPDPAVTVTFEKTCVRWGRSVSHAPDSSSGGADDQSFNISLKPLLRDILERLRSVHLPTANTDPFPADHCDITPKELVSKAPRCPAAHIDQQSFWPRLAAFLQPADVVLTETGTAAYGAHSLAPLPAGVTLIASALWLSIGYALAAAQGAALAQRERMETMAESESEAESGMVAGGEDDGHRRCRRSGRTILFTGDGSFQMTCQALSDVVRNRLDVVVFVLNNAGYTVERLIHGAAAAYNNVQPWRYCDAPWFFGAPRDDPGYLVSTWRVGTWGELEAVLDDPGVSGGRGLHVIEVVVGVGDAPKSLVGFAEYVRKRNAGELGDGS